MTLPELAGQAARCFAERHGRPPRWMAAAPGRVNLIGEHTDYNEGFVLPMAIARHTLVAAAPHPQPRATIFSATQNDAVLIDLDAPITPSSPAWANYVRGVVAGFRQRGLRLPGFEAVILSSISPGAGLASSAALAVATATLLEAAAGHRLEPLQKALLCQEAEQNFAGLPCGLMDQFTSVMARQDHLLRLDCRTHLAEPVPLTAAEVSILIVNSNVRHELTGGEYAARRAQCEEAARRLAVPSLREASLTRLEAARDRLDPVLFRRARHVITENTRTLAAAAALQAGRWSEVGQLMYASHQSLRDDFEVSCPELDLLVTLARQLGRTNGVYGSRLTGGGFGGCTVSLVKTAAVEAITHYVGTAYREKIGFDATVFVSRPEDGARLLLDA